MKQKKNKERRNERMRLVALVTLGVVSTSGLDGRSNSCRRVDGMAVGCGRMGDVYRVGMAGAEADAEVDGRGEAAERGTLSRGGLSHG